MSRRYPVSSASRPCVQENRANYARKVRADLGFPEAQDSPAHLPETPGVLLIPFNVSLDLREPVGRVRPAAQLLPPGLPVSTVPEVAIAENGEPCSDEDDVGSARQIRAVLAIPAAGGPEGSAKSHLTPGVRLFAASASSRSGSGGRRTKPLIARTG